MKIRIPRMKVNLLILLIFISLLSPVFALDFNDNFDDGIYTDNWYATGYTSLTESGGTLLMVGTCPSDNCNPRVFLNSTNAPTSYENMNMSVKIIQADGGGDTFIEWCDEVTAYGVFSTCLNGYIFRVNTGGATQNIYRIDNKIHTAVADGGCIAGALNRYFKMVVNDTGVFTYMTSDATNTTWQPSCYALDTTYGVSDNLKPMLRGQIGDTEWEDFYVYNYTNDGPEYYGKYNASLITDNSTNHFTKFNNTLNLNFSAFSANGTNLHGLQVLNVSIPGLPHITATNVTAGNNLAVIFNNSDVWNYTVITQDFYNSSTELISYFLTANVNNIQEVYNSSLLIGSYNPINFTYENSSQLTAFTVNEFINWNNTFYSGVSDSFEVSTIEGVAQNFTFYSLINVTWGDSTLNFNSSAKNQTFYKPFIDNCTSYGTSALNISWVDELNLSSVLSNSNFYMSVVLDNSEVLNFNITTSNVSSASLCIYPSWAEYEFDATIYYNYPGYYDREYYYSNSELNNQTKLLTLYMLTSYDGDRLDFIVTDSLNQELEGHKVIVKRWYPSTNSYIITDMIITDVNGEGSVFVQYSDVSSIYYEVLAQDTEDNPVYTASRLRFYDAVQEYTIKITENITSFWDRLDNFIYTSNANEIINGTTNVFSATVTDVTGNTLSADVFVWEYINSVKYAMSCNSSGVSASVTVLCDLVNVSGRVFYAEAWAYDISNPSNNLIVASEWMFRDSAPTFDDEGLLLGLILLGACIFLGSSLGSLSDSVGSTVIGSLLGFLIGLLGVNFTNLIYFNPITFSYLFGLVVVVLVIVIWRRE